MKLTTQVIAEIYKDKPIESLKDINVSKREIDSVDDISACKELRKLNLANNELVDEKSITGLKDLEQITLLNLSGNKFKDFTGFQHFQTLCVISHNKVDRVPRLSSILQLTKLSAAHNQLTEVPDLTHNVLLKEIRLNDNKITQIPETLRKCNAIEIMDFGNNGLANWTDIAALGSLTKLHNLNLKGNPIAKKKDYLEKILDLVPSLRILDGERFDPKFLERKKKQRENVNIVEKKQRMKRMKVQKEKKEKKERGEVDEDGDVHMKEADAPVAEGKKRKAKVTEILKVKAKKSGAVEPSDEPAMKKKKKTASDEKDLFFVKPEDKPVETKKTKATKATTIPKEPVAKKESVASVAAIPTLLTKPQTKAETGVVGVVDKSKKLAKAGIKKTTDVVAALESENKKQEASNTGTGLDVGGWD
ncbi:hypothetical protein INT48_006823 [Thamnidium elegans]|uniref:Uncharacterized protein n=1 Tax=Thamnidium elegans TaxID=101142 RepID=A0A8H7VWG8_9FUNG|nr:hypothetical protein INT48_006823 [Thamnidium elegans]